MGQGHTWQDEVDSQGLNMLHLSACPHYLPWTEPKRCLQPLKYTWCAFPPNGMLTCWWEDPPLEFAQCQALKIMWIVKLQCLQSLTRSWLMLWQKGVTGIQPECRKVTFNALTQQVFLFPTVTHKFSISTDWILFFFFLNAHSLFSVNNFFHLINFNFLFTINHLQPIYDNCFYGVCVAVSKKLN